MLGVARGARSELREPFLLRTRCSDARAGTDCRAHRGERTFRVDAIEAQVEAIDVVGARRPFLRGRDVDQQHVVERTGDVRRRRERAGAAGHERPRPDGDRQLVAALQPEPFVEISPELAQEKGLRNLDWTRITTPRGSIRVKALVTGRMRPFVINGQRVHHIGLPWSWGYSGIVTGDVTNDLTSLVADPNVSIHEGKAFTCNLERG